MQLHSPPGCPHLSWLDVVYKETHFRTDFIRHSAGRVSDWSAGGALWLRCLCDLTSCRPQWRGVVNQIVEKI